MKQTLLFDKERVYDLYHGDVIDFLSGISDSFSLSTEFGDRKLTDERFGLLMEQAVSLFERYSGTEEDQKDIKKYRESLVNEYREALTRLRESQKKLESFWEDDCVLNEPLYLPLKPYVVKRETLIVELGEDRSPVRGYYSKEGVWPVFVFHFALTPETTAWLKKEGSLFEFNRYGNAMHHLTFFHNGEPVFFTCAFWGYSEPYKLVVEEDKADEAKKLFMLEANYDGVWQIAGKYKRIQEKDKLTDLRYPDWFLSRQAFESDEDFIKAVAANSFYANQIFIDPLKKKIKNDDRLIRFARPGSSISRYFYRDEALYTQDYAAKILKTRGYPAVADVYPQLFMWFDFRNSIIYDDHNEETDTGDIGDLLLSAPESVFWDACLQQITDRLPRNGEAVRNIFKFLSERKTPPDRIPNTVLRSLYANYINDEERIKSMDDDERAVYNWKLYKSYRIAKYELTGDVWALPAEDARRQKAAGTDEIEIIKIASELERSQDFQSAAVWYAKSADTGDINSAVKAAEFFLKAEKDPAAHEKGIRYAVSAFNEGRSGCAVYLTDYYVKRAPDAPDYDNAIKWLERVKPSVRGAAVLYRLAYCYYCKAASDKDMKLAKKAAAFFLRAAKAGSPEGKHFFGVLCMEGLGVEKNESRGLYWLRRAARDSQKDAMEYLARFYNSEGNPRRDFKKTLFWGYYVTIDESAPACRYIGSCYLTGNGVEKNYYEAAYFLDCAVKSGDPGAAELLVQAKSFLPEDAELPDHKPVLFARTVKDAFSRKSQIKSQ